MALIFLSFLAGIALLVSAAVIYYRLAGKQLYLILLISGIAALNIFSENEYLHFLSSITVIGAAAGYSFRNGRTFQFYLLFTSLSLTIILSLNYYFIKNYKDIDMVSKSRDAFMEIVGKSESITEANKNDLVNKMNESLDILRDVIPFSFFANSLLMGLFSIFFLKYLFIRKYQEKITAIEGIEKFRIKDYFIFILIAGWLAVLLLDSAKYHFPYVIGLNAALILSVLYIIQAFGIIKYFMAKKGLPTLILPVFIIIILFLGIEYILFVLVILSSLGALDFWADFRKLDAKIENKEDLK